MSLNCLRINVEDGAFEGDLSEYQVLVLDEKKGCAWKVPFAELFDGIEAAVGARLNEFDARLKQAIEEHEQHVDDVYEAVIAEAENTDRNIIVLQT